MNTKEFKGIEEEKRRADRINDLEIQVLGLTFMLIIAVVLFVLSKIGC